MSLNVSANFSSSYYLRNFYSSNRSARISTNRSHLKNQNLVTADATAVEKALKSLQDEEYTSSNGGDILNSVSAFVSSYNNLISSTKDSDFDYVAGKRLKMKSLTQDEEALLSKIGITIGSSGKLTLDEDTLATSSIKKVKKLFSKSSDFSDSITKIAKQIHSYLRKVHTTEIKSTTDSASTETGTSTDATSSEAESTTESKAATESESTTGTTIDTTDVAAANSLANLTTQLVGSQVDLSL